MLTLETTITLNLFPCCECGAQIALTDNHERTLRKTHKSFYCPSGHSQCFPQQTEVERLRKALNAAEIEQTRIAKALADTQAERDKLQLRAAHGVCPCCKRTFKQLAAHMNRKHPEFGKGARHA